jgi:hypothetical protein
MIVGLLALLPLATYGAGLFETQLDPLVMAGN